MSTEKFVPTAEEMKSLEKAMKDENFRSLLFEYAKEMQDPENRKQMESEIAQMEAQQGNDVKFINPDPGYVVKTKLVPDGTKVFVNICQSDVVEEPTKTKDVQNGKSGVKWAVPHSVTTHREDIDKSGGKCIVYDVVFHPTAISMTTHHASFKRMIETTALDGITQRFPQHVLDRNDLRYPKIKFKGVAHKSMIRTAKGTNTQVQAKDHESTMEKMMNQFGKDLSEVKTEAHRTQQQEQQAAKLKRDAGSAAAEAEANPDIVPTYTLVHRGEFDMQDFRGSREAAPGAGRPKELVLRIELPKCPSAKPVDLDITEREVILDCRDPGPYHLEMQLPYPVDPDEGSAKFDKSKRALVLTLPVLAPVRTQDPKPFVEPIPESRDEEADAVPAQADAGPEDGADVPPTSISDAIDGPAAMTAVEDVPPNVAPDATTAASDGTGSPKTVLAQEFVDRMAFHQTDEVVSIQLPPLGGAVTADLGFEEVCIGPITTHRVTATLRAAPQPDGTAAAVAAVVFAFDIALETAECSCSGVDGKDSGETIVLLLRKKVAIQLQRLRAGVTPKDLQEYPFLTKENIEAAKTQTELWTSTTHPSVESIRAGPDGDGGTAIHIDVRGGDSQKQQAAMPATTKAPAPPSESKSAEEIMAAGLQKMLAQNEPAAEAPKSLVPVSASVDTDGYSPLETARLKVYADATGDAPAGPGAPSSAPSAQPPSEAADAAQTAFIAADAFEGAKEGYYFTNGPSGLGYYLDNPPVPSADIQVPAAATVRLTNSYVDELE